MTGACVETAIVGAGPRGLSVLERLCARERKSPSCRRLTVHLVDPAPPGAGRVWRRDQPRHLLMNTVASQVSVFTDASVTIGGPIEEGPSLYEWSQALVHGTLEAAPGLDPAEARDLGPDAYPTRAFYGHYLHWVFGRLVAGAPAHMEIRVHARRAVSLDDESDGHAAPADGADPPQLLVLDDGTRLGGLASVVLAQGHVPVQLTGGEAAFASFAAERDGLTYIPPANPADVDLAALEAGRPVLLRGLGLNFFDYLALLTLGRGGRFERSGSGALVYLPSGEEPQLYAGSRRGVPHHARGENEKGAHGRYRPRLLTAERAAALRRPTGERPSFRTALWPLIAKEVEAVYYAALLTARGADGEGFAARYLAGEAEPADADIAPADHWDWAWVERPYAGRDFTGPENYRDWLLGHLRQDVRHARQGNVSGPVKAALDVLRDLRNEIRIAVDHQGLDGASHRDELDRWYTPLNAFLSIGPPASRIEELVALIEAGTVVPVGPGMAVSAVAADDEEGHGARFVAASSVVPGPPVHATALIEARVPESDLRRTADPLLRHLVTTGQATTYRIPVHGGSAYETGGLAVAERPYRLVDAEGRAHRRRFAYGVPTESVHWVTAAGIRPGVGSVTLEDSDAIAAAVLSVPPVGPRPTEAGA